MNSLNTNYIYRFFSHAGPVEEVKKIEDLVIIVTNFYKLRNSKIKIVLIKHYDLMEE
jgi:hypothetical protein